jgi:hypothetical protein
MYVCGFCETQVGPRVEATAVVVETRAKVYPPRADGTRPTGYETVREVRACPTCADSVQL